MQKFSNPDYISMPWKNGGGFTTQLAIAPADADLGNFEWRISVAEVAVAGPFSLFAGIDRSLAVLHGSGLTLDLGGLHTTILTPDNKPLAFRGEQQVHAALLDGPITDFNVMTRRACWTHTLERMTLHGTVQYSRQADLMFIYCVHGEAVRVRTAAGEAGGCAAGDAVLVDGNDGDDVELSAASPALLYLVRLTAKGSPDAA